MSDNLHCPNCGMGFSLESDYIEHMRCYVPRMAQRSDLPLDLLITVCDACLQASCWQAKFFCDKAQSAGTVDLPVKRLLELNLEHPSYWLNDPRAEEYRRAS